MLILTATADTQGQRRNDFNWLTDTEPVYLGMQCDGSRPDDNCGCARAWTGMDTGKSGTTAVVTGTDLTREAYTARLTAALDRGGWGMDTATVTAMAAELLDVAAFYPAGTIVEHRGNSVAQRAPTGEDPASRRQAQSVLTAAGLDGSSAGLVLRRAYGHLSGTFNVDGGDQLGTVTYDRAAGTYGVRLPGAPQGSRP